MDRTQPSHTSLKTQYLIAYNLTSAILWSVLLTRVLLLIPSVGLSHVYAHVGEYAKWTQTLALLEIVHSATNLIRSPLPTTVAQVASRLLLVWGIVDTHPTSTGPSPFYSSMLTAWALSEVVRYSYFVLNLRGEVPAPLTWLRYNTFYVLYPIGIGSEIALVYVASGEARRPVRLLLWGVLGLYVPGAYVLYTHMIAQRRKVMRGKRPERRRA
ncbi:hypothetical protein MMC13_005395 [Lambiella insularis]|nr:hypothetical protein [Lambiella insularis]